MLNSAGTTSQRRYLTNPAQCKTPEVAQNPVTNEPELDSYIAAMRKATLPIGTQLKNLSTFYDVYKTAHATKILSSDRGRTIVADAFIESPLLGPLTELCVRALAAIYLPHQLGPLVTDNPRWLHIYYDNLSVDLPLENCYEITNKNYWRRVVYAKSHDRTIAYKKLEWKSVALTLKYVELVEACPAEFWPEEKMKTLAMKIYQYVTSMHLKHLQSLRESSFKNQIEAELAGDSSESSSDWSTSEEEEEAVEEEERYEGERHTKGAGDGHVHIMMPKSEGKYAEITEGGEDIEDASSFHSRKKITLQDFSERVVRSKAEYRAYRKQRKAIRAAKQQRHEAKQLARQRASIRGSLFPYQFGRLSELVLPEKQVKKAKGVFDIVVEPPESDNEELKIDRRNLHRLMEKYKRFSYPADQCHHIDLRFVRFFPLLTSFTIEFLGPEMKCNYHSRHFNFSTRDIEHLAYGLAYLEQLQIFSLCNSRMNAKKLLILTYALKKLPHITTIHFKNNQLEDDCGPALFELFQQTNTIKSLELEGNQIGADTLQQIGDALSGYNGTLEYLGLGRNPLEDDSLHLLNQGILGTQQIRKLCLTGISITQEALWCCVANELMRQHPPLIHLDISAVPVEPRTAEELAKALQVNNAILVFEIRGCNMPTEIIVEIEVLVKRNCFMANSPFIGDSQTTETEVNAYLNRLKHPVLINALTSAQKRSRCWFHRTGASKVSRVFERLQDMGWQKEPQLPQPQSLFKELEVVLDAKDMDKSGRATLKNSNSIDNEESRNQSRSAPFIYDANSFDEEEFKKYVYMPGPTNRYYHFRDKTRW